MQPGKTLIFVVSIIAMATLTPASLLGQSTSSANPDRGSGTASTARAVSQSKSDEAVRQQDPLLYYLEARKIQRMIELASEVRLLDLDALGILEDWAKPVEVVKPEGFSVRSIYYMSRFHRKGFLNRFREVLWSVGGGRAASRSDTMETKVLRGLLQKVYGSPSSTLLDVPDERRRSEVDQVQFEYYFVVNDTIPVMVMDIDGPKETGLLFATDLHDLPVYNDVRSAILDRILTATEPAPFNDYYFDQKEKKWFETGFDGKDFFTEEIKKPRHAWERPRLRLSPER